MWVGFVWGPRRGVVEGGGDRRGMVVLVVREGVVKSAQYTGQEGGGGLLAPRLGWAR